MTFASVVKDMFGHLAKCLLMKFWLMLGAFTGIWSQQGLLEIRWIPRVKLGSESFFLYTPTSPSRTRPKTGLSVIGDEPCRLNGTTQALGEPVEVNHLRRTIHRVPRGSHPPDRPGGLTLPLRPSASHHRQRIPARQLSEDYLVPDNLGQHPGPGLVTPYLNRRGAHSKHMPQASMLYWVAKSSRASLMPSRGPLGTAFPTYLLMI